MVMLTEQAATITDARVVLELPSRGFPEEEFQQRLAKFQQSMDALGCDAVILTTEPEVRYFSGFLTQFWQSPTRPWFLVIPAAGKPIAVIPEIGASGMRRTWIEDIRTWPSPRPEDDGVSLLVETVKSLPRHNHRIGMSLGPESLVRMPAEAFAALRERLDATLVDIADTLQRQRMVKSAREVDRIEAICRIAGQAFEHLAQHAAAGQTEREICRRMQRDLLDLGADGFPYMVAGSGPGGYDSIIMGPTDRVVEPGDLLIIDTGSVRDGYFCDFDRNWAFGRVDNAARDAYRVTWEATEAGFVAARPGATTSDLWRAMQSVLAAGGSTGNDVGRMGHGLGMELTERPSITSSDETELANGMVLTLEPGMTFAAGRQMVHEENIVITDRGARWLTPRAPEALPIL